MRKAGAICAFAVAVGCIASLSWPQSAVNRVTVVNRVSLLVTVALLVGLWVAGRTGSLVLRAQDARSGSSGSEASQRFSR